MGAAVSVKIFISCVTDEFRDYRDQLRTDLTRHNVEVKVQEDFKDYGVPTVVNDDVYISTCDAVIHLVGDMTGAMAQPASTRAVLAKYPDITEKLPPLHELLERGEEISYTQWEAWLTLYHGKPLLIAQAAEAAEGRGPAFMPTAASRAAQQAHLDRLRAVEHYPGSKCGFISVDQLAKEIAYTTILDLLAKERGGVAARPGGFSYGNLAVVVTLVLALTPSIAEQWKRTLDNPLVGLLALALTGGGGALALVYSRYFGLLGASDGPVGSRDRKGYDALRDNLATGGPATNLYARRLEASLNKVDGFFGDAGMAERTLFQRAFGLRTPAPLWTAPSFDRCLFLALLYPVVTIFIMWAVSGDVGPAEEALKLQASLEGWQRGVGTVLLGISIFSFRRWTRAQGIAALMWFEIGLATAFTSAIGAGVLALAVIIALIFAGARVLDSFFTFEAALALGALVGVLYGIVIAIYSTGDIAPTSIVAGVIIGFSIVAGIIIGFVAGTAVGAALYALTHALLRAFTGAFAGVGAVAAGIVISIAVAAAIHDFGANFAFALAAAVAVLNDIGMRKERQGVFLSLYLFAMVILCFGAAVWLPRLPGWSDSGPLLLFLGLLTLINAPFDWASLGLTRALLRRGLELKGWWPFFLALADAMAAAVIIALLALTMVIGVQTFDALAIYGGGAPVLPLTLFDSVIDYSAPGWHFLLDGIAAHPELPEYWWVYALLLSTMIPSLINLAIGGTALMRAVPGLSPALLHFMPAAGGVPTYDRAWIAAVLTLQAALGAILGVAVQAAVAWGLIFHAMPAAGLGLLDLARGLAALDLPARAIVFFAGL
jgi:hypothetical protein